MIKTQEVILKVAPGKLKWWEACRGDFHVEPRETPFPAESDAPVLPSSGWCTGIAKPLIEIAQWSARPDLPVWMCPGDACDLSAEGTLDNAHHHSWVIG